MFEYVPLRRQRKISQVNPYLFGSLELYYFVWVHRCSNDFPRVGCKAPMVCRQLRSMHLISEEYDASDKVFSTAFFSYYTVQWRHHHPWLLVTSRLKVKHVDWPDLFLHEGPLGRGLKGRQQSRRTVLPTMTSIRQGAAYAVGIADAHSTVESAICCPTGHHDEE